MPETRVQRIGRIAARVATIVVVLAAVAVKVSVDRALAQLEAAAQLDD